MQTLKEPAPSGQSQALGQPDALTWDARVFTSPAQLKAYLGPKAYARWSVRHPTAFGAPAPNTPKTETTSKPTTKATKAPTKKATKAPTKKATKAPTKKATKAPTKVATRSTPVSTTSAPETSAQSQSHLARALTLLLVLGGLALGLSALVPYRIAPAPLRRLYARPDRRPVALAAATAMVLGFGVAFYLG